MDAVQTTATVGSAIRLLVGHRSPSCWCARSGTSSARAMLECRQEVNKRCNSREGLQAGRGLVGDVACDDPRCRWDGDVPLRCYSGLLTYCVLRRRCSVRGRPHAILRLYHAQHHGQLPRSKQQAQSTLLRSAPWNTWETACACAVAASRCRCSAGGAARLLE
jgi:hypothetical protein